ncbi:MAG: PTS glucitol/sorbitol transporter subunit IIB [Intestinibacter sp.]|uniref:PTS glucitol/sorbitol transporter subunit IIB n=1 Tax=Intestinibacter sp. TaxID=1965304 RepID=UPI0025BDFDFF|nr:PTS glucitol/sorbitol transporter subunit IIB [Intestinibacter sp.]MCI6738919.1 PTS glucitol/sorbitol transporter subunit IIB [Intestinibacter sp.]
MSEYKSIVINRGSNGWGGPLTIVPTETKNKILVVTGGGFPPLAQHIANMTGCELVDGFKTTIPDEEVILAIVDCGGTARCGVYPKKGIFTVNLTPVGKSGPLAKFITEEIYVSDVKPENVSFCDGTAAPAVEAKAEEAEGSSKMTREEYLEKKAEAQEKYGEVAKEGFLTRLGKGVGNVVSTFYQAARDAVQTTLTNILPFMIFVSLIVGIINGTGVGNWLANTISPLASSLPGMLVISLFCALPFISPLIGPGAVIAQIIGVLLGNQIAQGGIQPQYALPALFAIDAQVGGDFVPVGLSLSEAEAETVEIGVPAVLFSRVITGPLAVLIAYAASFGMF